MELICLARSALAPHSLTSLFPHSLPFLFHSFSGRQFPAVQLPLTAPLPRPAPPPRSGRNIRCAPTSRRSRDGMRTMIFQPFHSPLSLLSAARMSMYRPPHWMTTATSTAAGAPLGATAAPTTGAENQQHHHHWSSPPRTNASPTSPPPPPTSSALALPPTTSATIHPAAAPTAGYTTTTPGRTSSVESYPHFIR